MRLEAWRLDGLMKDLERNVESEHDLSIEACVNLIALKFEGRASLRGRIGT
jgi:hypothetical protein